MSLHKNLPISLSPSSPLRRPSRTLITLTALIAFPLSAHAWNGALSGQVVSGRGETPLEPVGGAVTDGAGRLSDEDGLSVFGSFSLEGGGLALLTVRVKPERLGQRLSLPGEGRLVSYQERSPSGELLVSASAYRGWLQVDESVTGRALVSFELSVRQGDELRSLATQSLLLTALSDRPNRAVEVHETGEVWVTAVEPEESGCDGSSEGEDVYETEESYPSCDESTDDFSDDSWNDSTDDTSSGEDSSCDDDEWAAEASPHKPRKPHRRRAPLGRLILTLLRLSPWLSALLLIAALKRRARRALHQAQR